MSVVVPLPPSVRAWLKQNTHPGLLLDKYVESWDPGAGIGKLSERVQKPALEAVVRLSQAAPDGFDFPGLLARRKRLLEGLSACLFECVTTGPLTLHLARASALENAGICLHPLYGFVYLPGSGLKGMARTYAVLVWKPAQPDPVAAQATIEAVFGNEPGEPKATRQRAGAVVFHEAWPTQWPRLLVDILNNHHAKYYQGDDAPGDWENPVPVYFLAVPPQTAFEFALTKRTGDDDDCYLQLAKDWLLGALIHFGAGAKTNAGYGNFKPVADELPTLKSTRHAAFKATLELVTPAFLAGANQQSSDCDLRPATLRGLLRWWWRTMHAGHVDLDTLRQMEVAIWGDTNGAGVVRTTVEKLRIVGPYQRPGKKLGKNKREQAVLEDDPAFVTQNDLEAAPKFTTQGLFYAAYGTDEMKTGDVNSRKRRWYVDAGSQWTLGISARSWIYEERNQHGRIVRRVTLPAALLLDQARAAVWLLCQHGGVGSKSRKGFGSFADPESLADWSWDKVQQTATKFRQTWSSESLPYRTGRCDSLCLSSCRRLEIPTSWRNTWFALDQLGASRQSFAQAPTKSAHGKHCPNKVALGLPRKIHGPLPFALPHQKDYTPPEDLSGPMGDRYAAPIVFHLTKGVNSGFVIRAVAFTPPRLWAVGHHDEQDGPSAVDETLRQLLTHLENELSTRQKRLADRGQKTVVGAPPNQPPQPPTRTNKVRVKVLAKHTLPNSFKVQEEGKDKPGILQFGKPPDRLPEIGSTIEVFRHGGNPQSPQYRWDPPPPAQPAPGGRPRGRK